MFHRHIVNNKINRLNERRLRLSYRDISSAFEKLLEQDTSVMIHYRNLQILAKKIFKVYLHQFSVRFVIDMIYIVIYESIQSLQCQT